MVLFFAESQIFLPSWPPDYALLVAPNLKHYETSERKLFTAILKSKVLTERAALVDKACEGYAALLSQSKSLMAEHQNNDSRGYPVCARSCQFQCTADLRSNL